MSDFQGKQDRIVADHEERKAWMEWLKLPPWERYESDHINGLDDGEKPEHTIYPTQEELEQLVGHKLMNISNLPY